MFSSFTLLFIFGSEGTIQSAPSVIELNNLLQKYQNAKPAKKVWTNTNPPFHQSLSHIHITQTQTQTHTQTQTQTQTQIKTNRKDTLTH